MKNIKLLIAAGLLAFSFNVSAATVTYNSGDGVIVATGDINGTGTYDQDNSAFDATDVENILGITAGTLELSYKSDGTEEEGIAITYETYFDNDRNGGYILADPSGPFIDCPDCFLVVKDGSNDPIWYIFELVDWDGKETLNLSGFWADTQGDISHVAIYSGVSAVPIPAAVWLFGSGIIGLVGVARRKV